MVKTRVLIFLITLTVIGLVGTIAIYYARGYRFDSKTLKFVPRGLLVVNSDPNGAQIFVNGELETATNATIALSPGTYDLSIKKEGYLTWQKRVVIEKEVVTQINTNLFPVAPSLSATTFSGALNPSPSPDFSKIAYVVPFSKDDPEKGGLWVLETVNLPIGFSREARQVTDGDLATATWQWSPDSREILLTVKKSVFLLNTSDFTPQKQRINVAAQKESILDEWQALESKKLTAKLAKLPDELETILTTSATNIQFSPDENKILYLASASASIPDDLIKPLPGASTQKQERNVVFGKQYVYDIKEDRNFMVADNAQATLYWFPSSTHLIQPEKDKIIILDYDGTNHQEVYSGSYVFPHAFPYSNTSRLLILTNLGANGSLPNLYSLNLK